MTTAMRVDPPATPRLPSGEGEGEGASRTAGLRFRRRVTLAVVLANLLFVGLGALTLWQGHRHRTERVQLVTANFAALIEQRILDLTRMVDDALVRVQHAAEAELAGGRVDTARLHAFVEAQLRQLPEVDAIRLSDARGVLWYGRGVTPEKPFSFADRTFFARHRAAQTPHLIIEPPLMARISQVWAIPFTRPYYRPDGRFAGIISAAVPVESFAALLKNVDPGAGGTVVFRHLDDMGLIVRYPPLDGPAGEPGHRQVSADFIALVKSGLPDGHFLTPRTPDGVERSYAYRRIADLPFTLAVGMSVDEYLDGWRKEAWGVGILLAALLAATNLAAWLIGRYWQQRQEMYRQHQEALVRRAVLIDQSSDGIAVHDQSHRVIEANPRFAEMLGYTPDEVLQLYTWEFDAQFDEAAIRADFADLSQIHRTFETRHRRKDGTTFAVEVSATGARLRDQDVVITVSRDITERQAQADLAALVSEGNQINFRVVRTLQDSNAPFDDVLCRALAELAGLRSLTPGANARLFIAAADGRPAQELHHGQPLWQQPGTPDHVRQVQVVAHCLLKEPAHGHYFVPLKHGDEQLGTLVLDTEPVPFDHPLHLETLRTIGDSFAVALIKQHNLQMMALARDQAEAASRAKTQFLAAMSHEIRTPMNGILGMAQLLLMAEPDADERREYARVILNSGQTLLALLNDILDLSKVEAGKFSLTPVSFDPERLLDDTAALFAGNARDKGLAFTAHWRGPPRRYRADAVRLRQMLNNLINNALKFTARGEIALVANEAAAPDAATVQLRFAVRDSGIGIAADKLDRLFKPFTQVDGSLTRQYGGTGLGLSLVKSLAELMGGKVGVESTPGVGSTFWFTVCADVDTTIAEPLPPASPSPAAPAPAALPTPHGAAAPVTGVALPAQANKARARQHADRLERLAALAQAVEGHSFMAVRQARALLAEAADDADAAALEAILVAVERFDFVVAAQRIAALQTALDPMALP